MHLAHPRRRHAVLALCFAACGAASWLPAAAADKFPSKPVTVIVPQAAGGANDAIARVVAQKLAEQWGGSVIVENRPGAGGNVGTAYAAKAKPDGYTLLITADSAQVINPWLYKNTGFDPVKDFEPVAPLATAGYVLVAHPSFAANTVAELIALAKAQPGKYAIASAGNGTLNHLIGEMLQKAAGIELQHIPYKGSAAAATDVVGGQVPLSVQSLPSSIAFIKAGKLKVLGVVNEKRVAALPDAPTIGETLKGFGQTPWYGLFAPAGTPAALVAQLQADVARALEHKDVVERLAGVGCEPFKGSTAQLGKLVRDDLARWQRVVKETGATLD
ncbi:tripartite tricarboxylate transporter substrate binding protein [Acidovorax lacteus]|uniref:Tripartite tricarboxylate transporter substrate binding protein n=1 Tax=Acidovorax lacteus TaxID=1924988 RepID=A0ABP8LJM0_9BURK